ncbi:S-layer homology domain-containing protein [Candidatus Peregrinibacteria bacterium]|nr:MAG: S-layer homology domain-containing protein [Candidatus Peregrinibacteria bacterium]
MFQTTLNRNGSGDISWLESSHPQVYGYGIEVTRSLFGFDRDQGADRLADLSVIMLPKDPESTLPTVLVNGAPVASNTLITSATSVEEAERTFGLAGIRVITGADRVTFPTLNASIALNALKAVYVVDYTGPHVSLPLANGFYHMAIRWFDRQGFTSTVSGTELLAPQRVDSVATPIDLQADDALYVPVYRPAEWTAAELLTDLSGSFEYAWDTDQDGVADQTGERLFFPAQAEPKTLWITLYAGTDLNDPSYEVYQKAFKVVVYSPGITLDSDRFFNEGVIAGHLIPLNDSDSLDQIPFGLFRKRWGQWKNLGLLKHITQHPTVPDVSGTVDHTGFYTTTNAQGDYEIDGLIQGDRSIVVYDTQSHEVARVHAGTGHVELLDERYELIAATATDAMPTRLVIVERASQSILANVVYVADADTDVTLVNGPLQADQLAPLGVTLGDPNPTDSIVADLIPGSAAQFGGGAALYNQQTNTPIALIDTDGTLRLLNDGYRLRPKNIDQPDAPVLFELVNEANQPVMELFIRANFDALAIDQTTLWDELSPRIGTIKSLVGSAFAALGSNGDEATNPFPDVPSDHPYYQAILDLYSRRIVQGYGDGLFPPDATLSRAEFVKIALGSTTCLDCTTPTDALRSAYDAIRPFPDVSLPAWYHYCVSIAKEQKMVTGYGDGLFRPDRTISRAEAAAVLMRQASIPLVEAPDSYFEDVPNDAWYADAVYTAVQIGLLSHQSGFVFPDQPITRGEFAFMATGVLSVSDCRLVPVPPTPGDATQGTSTGGTQTGSTQEPPVSTEVCPCVYQPGRDTDRDGLNDACDADVDADGVENVLCLFDGNGQLDPHLVAESADNCIFNPNPNQADADGDGVGDVCEPLDQCPNIPEDNDGVEDQDGCPEVDRPTPLGPPGVTVNRGPLCFFLDYAADLVAGDEVMTAITDLPTQSILYSESNPLLIPGSNP